MHFVNTDAFQRFKMRILFITTFLLSLTEAVDIKRLAKFPMPDSNFDLKQWATGPWYHQARYIPCSFSGSKKFSDIRVEGKLVDNHVKQSMTWRDGVCTNVMLRLDVLGHGKFTQIDPIGGMMNGDQVTVVYNPKKGYGINLGCTKTSVDGDCSDSWVLVKTRDRYPRRYVWECIVRDLKRLFDLSLREMVIVSHRRPC